MEIIHLLLLSLLLLQLLWACYTDIRYRIIGNDLIVSMLFTAMAFSFSYRGSISLIFPLIILTIGFIIFIFGLIGGGDVKMITVLACTLTPMQTYHFITYTAIMGGVVMIIGLIISRSDIKERGVPYGVAIASGFSLSLFS
ncbi:prepilin peptidase [Yersinia ruckeri]|uniref:A24 family peptidase n=1 Tax=Yersinia ruckeri TaxID=29486 RepID=UPI0011AA81F5|nr:prepilin peptidase [Yersinia ruckeri]EKN3347959.1 prepilin peptidase [Yersinia ruckeri]EKN3363178.1 prepilin peptidase [Yersinia ruckeri]EKN4202912.1 prepilin peptidase [Yersinia ruckeri]EKN4208929.1 prepilin peptidase [Yersinia ruckeri]EKN4699432.1 prepilin peptidase [Yersinia ruckeri]